MMGGKKENVIDEERKEGMQGWEVVKLNCKERQERKEAKRGGRDGGTG